MSSRVVFVLVLSLATAATASLFGCFAADPCDPGSTEQPNGLCAPIPVADASSDAAAEGATGSADAASAGD